MSRKYQKKARKSKVKKGLSAKQRAYFQHLMAGGSLDADADDAE